MYQYPPGRDVNIHHRKPCCSCRQQSGQDPAIRPDISFFSICITCAQHLSCISHPVYFLRKIDFCSGGAKLGELVDSDYLLDFDILHVSHVSELLHYIQPEFLPPDLGGTCHTHPDTWLPLQRQVWLCFTI